MPLDGVAVDEQFNGPPQNSRLFRLQFVIERLP
jgi:hypothetical protein